MVHICSVRYQEAETFTVVSTAAQYEQDLDNKRLKIWKCSGIEFFLVWRRHIYSGMQQFGHSKRSELSDNFYRGPKLVYGLFTIII